MMWNYGFGWFGWLFMVAGWALVVAGIVWLVRSVAEPRDGAGGSGGSGARRILDERFASGELSVEEYEERRRALR